MSTAFDGPRARALRVESGISLENLAVAAGLSPNTVRSAESGAHQPRPRVAAAIATALGVTPHDLITTDIVTLRRARFVLGLTQREIAHRIGCSRQLVSRIERGAGRPGSPDAWSAAYELTPAQWRQAMEATQAAVRHQVAFHIQNRERQRPTGERG